MFTGTYDLEVSPGGIPPVIHVSQYDTGSRKIVFTLISGAGDLILPMGTRAEVRGTKPDGNGFSYDATITGKTVTVEITEQMTAAAGKVRCELVLYVGRAATTEKEASDDYQQLCTATFLLMVKRAALDKDTLASHSEIRQLVNVVDRTEELLKAASTMDQAKEEITEKTKEATDAAAEAKKSEDSAKETLETVNTKATQIAKMTTDADQVAREALNAAQSAGNEAASTSAKLDQVYDKMDLVQVLTNGKIDDAYVENGYLYLTSNDEIVAGPLGPFSGSGGGGGGGPSGNNAKLTLSNYSGWLSKTIAYGDKCPISIDWYSEEDGLPTGDGVVKITVSGATKAMINVPQGSVKIDLSPYLSPGSNAVRVNVSDVYGNNRTINFSVSAVVLTISSSFDDSQPYQGVISFPYVPTGNVSKEVHFLIDDREIGNVKTSVSGRQQSFAIPQQKHGAHTFRVYFDATIGGEQVRSNELYYELICLEALNTTPIITCNFHETEVNQYTMLHLLYNVYDPTSMTAKAVIKVNGETVSEQTVGRTTQDFAYRASEPGKLTFEIEVGEVSRSFTVSVVESPIQLEAETEGLVLYLSSEGRSNAEEKRSEWKSGEISATLSNFNFASDGWVKDSDGVGVLRVSGDARVEIPYPLFGSDFRTGGRTIELEFATRDVMNYDSVILSCLTGGKGLYLTAQKVELTSEQSDISMQFKEEEHVRVSFVIEKKSENRLIYCYINGILSAAVQYPVTDDFSQVNPVGISIGSNDCTIDLYHIRVYDHNLTRTQMLDNWIADTQDVELMLARYERNAVYNAYGSVVMDQLPKNLPYLVLECPELPQYKGDKKIVSGSYVDPLNPDKCFTFTDAQFDVQGTSSQYYERKNYKGKFKGGFTMPSGSVEKTYQIRKDSIPVSTFCFKADVASSEGANNVELVRLYNDSCPYHTPAQQEDPRIRQGIDGYPIAIFWNNGDQTVFIGKYNFNNDKSTSEVYGFEEGDESWEVLNNTSDRVLWKSADYSGDGWLNDFEARFPDTDPPYTDSAQLQEFASWLMTTDTEKATNQTLSAPVTYDGVEYTTDSSDYRLAKFKAEFGNYVETKSALFYYLFTEIFLMVDSRAKNMFPSFMGSRIGA